MPIYSWSCVLTQAQHCGEPKGYLRLFICFLILFLVLMWADVEETNYDHMFRLSWSSDVRIGKTVETAGIEYHLINVLKSMVEPL